MRKVVGVRSPTQQPKESAVQQTESPAVQQPARQTTPPPPDRDESQRQPIYRDETRMTLSDTEVKNITVHTVETNMYEGVLSSLGGGTITSWKLKNYLGKDGEWVELVPSDSALGNLSVILGNRTDLGNLVFNTALDTQWVVDGKHFRRIRFAGNLAGSGRVEKEFLFQDDRYDIDMRVRFISLSRQELGQGYDIVWNSGLHPTEKRIKDDTPYYQAYALQGGELLKTKERDTRLQEGSTQWVAVRTKYFVMAIIPQTAAGAAARLQSRKTSIPYEEGEVNEWKKFKVTLTMPSVGTIEEIGKFSVYLGPIDYPLVKAYGVELEKMMNFGWAIIRPISIGFYYVFQFLYGIVHNYGWAIIIFSIMIKIVLYPLTRKSFQSMRKMQELQPKLAALKEKYKKDPQKLNQETMKMYKQEGVNPMGGCLPMLLQMPVLFALFNLFRTTIMLRQASFLGGLIQDLSAPDAMIGNFNVLPILMGATMIIQQKLSTQNPQQKAMAYFMPIFFVFLFYQFSAGLNLYYLMFNVLTIAQEIAIKKHK
jgi:YidC/Oxa1 family membrane protein insertase